MVVAAEVVAKVAAEVVVAAVRVAAGLARRRLLLTAKVHLLLLLLLLRLPLLLLLQLLLRPLVVEALELAGGRRPAEDARRPRRCLRAAAVCRLGRRTERWSASQTAGPKSGSRRRRVSAALVVDACGR
jgi:hypothetical protein